MRFIDVMWSTDAHQLDQEKNNSTFFLVKGFETALSVNLNTLPLKCAERNSDEMRSWRIQGREAARHKLTNSFSRELLATSFKDQ